MISVCKKNNSNSTIDLSLPLASCEVITTCMCNINISEIKFKLQAAVLTFENELFTIIFLNQLMFCSLIKSSKTLLCFTMNRV